MATNPRRRRAATVAVALAALTTSGLSTAPLVAADAGASANANANRASTQRVSLGNHGRQGTTNAMDEAVSGSGRYVAFVSRASGLVHPDTNGAADVFVRDRAKATTRMVSVSSAGSQGNRRSIEPSISADGRHVAFVSRSSSLVPDDTNGVTDIFVRDLRSGTTTRASVGPDGQQANGPSVWPDLSEDGRYVAFTSSATNLGPADSGPTEDIYVRDLRTGRVTMASVGTGEVPGNNSSYSSRISADGRYVTFDSLATNLGGHTARDTWNVFLRDRRRGTTRLVSAAVAAGKANGDCATYGVSENGRFVVFESFAENLVPGGTRLEDHIYLRDVRTGRTRLVSRGIGGAEGNDGDWVADISADGRFVSFTSEATNLVRGDTNHRPDVFVWERRTGRISRVSVTNAGAQVSSAILRMVPTISSTGRVVAFGSGASNLVRGDTNHREDVFVRIRWGD